MPQHPTTPTESPTTEQQIAQITALPEFTQACEWLRTAEPKLRQWQTDLARIPAPPFGEGARGLWLADQFRQLALNDVHIDEVGNVLATHPGHEGSYVAISAHIDTVFPSGTPLDIRQEGPRLLGPGVSDNGAGVTAMLAIAAALQATALHPAQPILFLGNVGEEGEGDLRGMRHIFSQQKWQDSIACNLVLDGAGNDVIVAEALGSRRFEVTVRGPGGHSWSDYGLPNPIVILARAIDAFSRAAVPNDPKTSTNIGVIQGGTSVNSIPESGSMRVDIRSASAAEIDRLEHSLRLAVDQSVEMEQEAQGAQVMEEVSAEIVTIGDRPSGDLAPTSQILRVVRAVDRHLNNSAHIQRASTDANIPLSLGREALAIGGGGRGGGAHTLQEWFDCTNREQGLQRILLIALALTGLQE